jgi:hypothetical protein
MNKTNILFLLAALAIFAFVIIPNSGENKGTQRVVYWEHQLEADIPPNSPKENALLWTKKNKVEFTEPDETHMSIRIERVSGWGFASISCSDWDVVVDLTFNSFDEVTAKTVRKVSVCL